MRGFLWSQGTIQRGKARVAWKVICVPKYEGGLGIRKVADVNKALITKHIWSIISNRKSLWVQWVHSYKLKGDSFWNVKPRGSMSWCWRKLLQQRDLIRPVIRHKIGNGKSTSAWHDTWSNMGPLSKYISPRNIYNAGLALNNTVEDLIDDGSWKWPTAWYDLFPVLINLEIPTLLPDRNDTIVLRNELGVEQKYLATNIWEIIRYKRARVPWVNVVWFSECIPRQAFMLWLIVNNKLKTHDRLKPWEVGGATNLNLVCCSLCKIGPDSRNHIFFECPYAKQVWFLVREMAGMQHVSEEWQDILDYLTPISASNTARSIIGRLMVAATSYFLWQERNNRMFTNNKRNPDQLKGIIVDTVRLKLATLKFKGGSQTASSLFLVNGILPVNYIP